MEHEAWRHTHTHTAKPVPGTHRSPLLSCDSLARYQDPGTLWSSTGGRGHLRTVQDPEGPPQQVTRKSPGRSRCSSPHLLHPRAARAQRWPQLSQSCLSPGCLAGLQCRGESPGPGPGWTALGLNQARTQLRAGLRRLDPARASSGCPHLPQCPWLGPCSVGLEIKVKDPSSLPPCRPTTSWESCPSPRALVGKASSQILRLQAGYSAPTARAGGPLTSPQWAPGLGKHLCGSPTCPAHRDHT